jgi:uncharacterized protein
MKIFLLDNLVCPQCQVNLERHIENQQNGEIKTGKLSCNKCGEYYRIIDGIPALSRKISR